MNLNEMKRAQNLMIGGILLLTLIAIPSSNAIGVFVGILSMIGAIILAKRSKKNKFPQTLEERMEDFTIFLFKYLIIALLMSFISKNNSFGISMLKSIFWGAMMASLVGATFIKAKLHREEKECS